MILCICMKAVQPIFGLGAALLLEPLPSTLLGMRDSLGDDAQRRINPHSKRI